MNKGALIAKYGADVVEFRSELPHGYVTRQQVIDRAACEVSHARRIVEEYEEGKRGQRYSPEGRAEMEKSARERLAWWELELEINAVLEGYEVLPPPASPKYQHPDGRMVYV
jgi:hypothetical protein